MSGFLLHPGMLGSSFSAVQSNRCTVGCLALGRAISFSFVRALFLFPTSVMSIPPSLLFPLSDPGWDEEARGAVKIPPFKHAATVEKGEIGTSRPATKARRGGEKNERWDGECFWGVEGIGQQRRFPFLKKILPSK